MESEDKRKIHPPSHENHGVHVCHKCGWTFPNPHPSAKHRRAHKKVCGKMKGFNSIGSEEKAQSDSDLSDDDHSPHLPQPPLLPCASEGMGGKKDSGGVGIEAQGSGRSEEEMFSDAVAEFGDVESSRTAEVVVVLDARGADMNKEEIKGDGEEGHAFETPTVGSNIAQPNDLTFGDQFQDLDSLQSQPDNTKHRLHSTNATPEYILDKRTNLAVEQTEEGSSSPFLSSGASFTETNEFMENTDIYTSEKIDCSMTSPGLEMDSKDNENCNGLGVDEKDNKKSKEDENVPAMAMLPNMPASGFAGVGVPPALTDTGTITAVNLSSEVMDSKESDSKICHVHEEQTGGLEQQKPPEELSPSSQPRSGEAEADWCYSAETAPITEGSLPNEPSADVFPSTMPVLEAGRQLGNSGSGSMHEKLTPDQSSLGEDQNEERNQDIELASTECAHEDVDLNESTGHQDFTNALPVATNATSPDDLVMHSSKVEATTLICSEENKPSSLGEHDFVHELSHEVLLETPVLPVAGVDIADSVEVADVDRAIAVDDGEFDRTKYSGGDLSPKVLPETPTVPAAGVNAADSAVEAEVPQAIVTDSGGLDMEKDTGLDFSHVVTLENSTVPVAGGNIVDSAEGETHRPIATDDDVFDCPKDFGHDILHEVMPKTATVHDEGVIAYSIEEAEIHRATAVKSGGLDMVCEEVKTDHTKVVPEYSNEGATDELSSSVKKIIHDSVTDDSKISSQYHEDLAAYKLEGNLEVTESVHGDAAVGLKETDINNGSMESTSEPHHTDHSVLEMADSEHADRHHGKPKMDQSSEVGAYQLDVQNPSPEEPAGLATGAESCVQHLAVPENCSSDDLAAGDTSKIHNRSLPDAGGDAVLNQNVNASIMTTDVSVDSISQDESLEGHWGSVSDIPTPKEASTVSPKKGSASDGNHVDNPDLYEAPSFMTLVEPAKGDKRQPVASEIQSVRRPSSPSSQPGWFPSLTHVVNESQGRKKNEEIIAKVVNWSSGKAHTPLRNLLVEANIESKHKPPQTAQDSASPKPREELALEDAPAKTGQPELHTGNTAKGDAEKEWSSPARLPVIKRERRKLRGWVPFVCCSSIN